MLKFVCSCFELIKIRNMWRARKCDHWMNIMFVLLFCTHAVSYITLLPALFCQETSCSWRYLPCGVHFLFSTWIKTGKQLFLTPDPYFIVLAPCKKITILHLFYVLWLFGRSMSSKEEVQPSYNNLYNLISGIPKPVLNFSLSI